MSAVSSCACEGGHLLTEASARSLTCGHAAKQSMQSIAVSAKQSMLLAAVEMQPTRVELCSAKFCTDRGGMQPARVELCTDRGAGAWSQQQPTCCGKCARQETQPSAASSTSHWYIRAWAAAQRSSGTLQQISCCNCHVFGFNGRI